MRELLYLIPKLLVLVTIQTSLAFGEAFTYASQSFAASPPKQLSSPSLGEQMENFGRLYKGDDNDVLQELWLLGRFHGQYYSTNSNAGGKNDYETRRFRLGGQARIFKKMAFHLQMIGGTDIDPFYDGFSELWTQWTFSRELIFTIGQQKHRFTHDRNVSSRYHNYLERGMLTNMFNANYSPALTLSGNINSLDYFTGIFSNSTGPNMHQAFTDLDSGYSYLATAYYNLGKVLNSDACYIYSSFIHSEVNAKATTLDRFKNGISTALILTDGASSLISQITSGVSSKDGNAVGINIEPGYFVSNEFQLVGRYQLAGSNAKDGLLPQARYEQEVNIPSGKSYQAGYLGINYYLAKHRLKLMTGVEYSLMDSEDAWTVSTAFRTFFGPHSGGAFPMNQLLDGGVFQAD